MARAAADARYDPLLAQKCAVEMSACAAEGIEPYPEPEP